MVRTEAASAAGSVPEFRTSRSKPSPSASAGRGERAPPVRA